MNTKQRQSKYLESHQIKPTEQRLSILNYLESHRTHPKVEDIYASLSPTMPSLSKTTIYNTLKLFVEHGIAIELTFNNLESHYDGDLTPHAHFYCRKCNNIYDIPLPEEVTASHDEFKIEAVQVCYRGLCTQCIIE